MTYEHGTKMAYVHDHCRCRPCTDAWNVYQQKLHSRHRRGDVWADPADYRPILDDLIDTWGLTPSGIGKAAQIKPDAIRRLHAGGHVHPDVAARLHDLTIDDFPDNVLVDSDHAWQILHRLTDADIARNRIATHLGWGSWPGRDYPKTRRVKLGLVRALQELLDDVTAPRCDECGEVTDGTTWCWPCFTARTIPSKAELDEIAGRRAQADRKRRERARRTAAA